MKRATLLVSLACCGLLYTVGCAAKTAHFGEPMKLTADDTLCAGKVFAAKDEYDGKYVRVRGKVDSVCAHRGCWLKLTDCKRSDTMFVKFTCPVEGRLIPTEAVGKVAIVEGTLEVAEIAEAEARHYAEDAGASKEEIAKIVGPQKQLRMRSPAANIEGI